MAALLRAVVVHRRTELESLVDQHGTRGAAEFFLRSRGRSLGEVQDRHDRLADALATVRSGIPVAWRRGDVERADLPRFGFEPDDVVVAVGQDGLVANVAKYLDGQPVIGVDPEPGRNPGVLVGHAATRVAGLLAAVDGGAVPVQTRVMVHAELDDGQRLDALNEVFVGHPSHQSARYRLQVPGQRSPEPQSSSGLIAATGTGATGWAASIVRERGSQLPLPAPTQRQLAWFVREAWPSPTTGTAHTQGLLPAGATITVTAETDTLVVFGDGVESDRLTATWGQQVRITVADRRLRLVGIDPP